MPELVEEPLELRRQKRGFQRLSAGYALPFVHSRQENEDFLRKMVR